MTVNEAMVRKIQQAWSNTASPVRPNKALVEIFRSVVQRSGGRVLILGATPELVDMCIDEGVRRLVSMELVPEVTVAMRRLGNRDWKGVELLTGNWLEHRRDLDGSFDAILCAGGLLFLDFPDAWRAVFANIARYLTTDGWVAAKSAYIPSGSPSFEDYTRQRLIRFDRESVDCEPGERQNLYRNLAAETMRSALLGTQRDDGSIDSGLLEEHYSTAAAEIKLRNDDSSLHEIIDQNLGFIAHGFMARVQNGKPSLRTSAPPDLGRPLIEQFRFTVDIVPAPSPPVVGADHVYIATRSQRPA